MSLFDKFFNAKDKLQPAVEPTDNDAVPGANGAKILSESITKKLAQRHQQMMTLTRVKQQEQDPPLQADAAPVLINNNALQLQSQGAKNNQQQQQIVSSDDDNQDDEQLQQQEDSKPQHKNKNRNNIDDADRTHPATHIDESAFSSVVDGSSSSDNDEDEDDDEDDDVPEDEEGTSIFATVQSEDFAAARTNSSSNWNKKGDASSDFLVFGGARANALKSATNTSRAVELSEAEQYMARVSGFTFVAATAAAATSKKTHDIANEKTDNGSADGKYFKVNYFSSAPPSHQRGSGATMVAVDVEVPLWAAHRFTPRSMLVKEETTVVVSPQQQQQAKPNKVGEDAAAASPSVILKDTPLKKQLLSTNPANKREAAAVRTYLNGYSPIDCIALHQEILDFYDWIRPTEAELVLRTLIETQVKNIANALFPGSDPIVYGSQTTGLLLPWSDLDMSILNVTNSTVQDGLLALSKQITLNAMCEGHAPQVILKTKVPLIKFKSAIAPIDVDVSINAGDGKQNSEWISKNLAKFPESKYLIILVKYFLHQRDLNEPYRGGVGSFAATLLVLSFLQHHPIYTTDCENRSSYGLGRLFVDFLQYYGSLGFNPERIGISLRSASSTSNNINAPNDILAQNGGCVFFQRDSPAAMKCRPRGAKGPTKLDIEDPVTLDNNAASSVRLIQMVQSSFDGAFLLLTARAPALNSLLAPAHLFPHRSQLYLAPELFTSAESSEFKKLFGSLNPVNDHVTCRPTLLSRIIHHDVDLVGNRIATQETFNRYQRDQLSKEAQLFHAILKSISKTKGYQTQVEIKSRQRYDVPAASSSSSSSSANNNTTAASPTANSKFQPQIIPHSPFALGYNRELHEEYFKNKVGEIVKNHKHSLGALVKTQIGEVGVVDKNQNQRERHRHVKKSSTSNEQEKQQSGDNRKSSSSQQTSKSSQSQSQSQPQSQQSTHQQQRRQRDEDDYYSELDEIQYQQSNKKNLDLPRKKQTVENSNRSSRRKNNHDDDSDNDDDGGNNFKSWQNAY